MCFFSQLFVTILLSHNSILEEPIKSNHEKGYMHFSLSVFHLFIVPCAFLFLYAEVVGSCLEVVGKKDEAEHTSKFKLHK